jgi:hypothetical protein
LTPIFLTDDATASNIVFNFRVDCRAWAVGWRMEDGGWRMQDAGCRMQDAGCRMQDEA